ncbi:MAG: UDP-galactopyranose mutase [Bacilli bacterium]|jgi:UDP-galactopyranose mutase
MKVYIIGAGPAGCSLAHLLADKGYKVEIYEQRKTLAGNLYDYRKNGLLIQKYGPHIFHTNLKNVADFLIDFDEWFFYEHRVKGRVDAKLVPIPFNFSSIEKTQSNAKELITKLKKIYPDNSRISLGELLKNSDASLVKLGKYIHERVFKNYSQKQWGLALEELDPSIAKRVPIIMGYDDRYFDDRYQMMPRNGYTALFEKMLKHPNIKLKLGIKPNLRLIDGIILLNGKKITEPLFYTGSLDDLFSYCFGRLAYRTVDFQFKEYAFGSKLAAATINYPNAYKFTRISEFNKITMEKPCENYSVTVKEFPRLASEDDKLYYPLSNQDNLKRYQAYLALTKDYPNLYLLGRLATYKYLNIDEVVNEALKIASKF